MPTIPTILAFAFAVFILMIVPGPSVLYVVTRGIDQGRRAAIVSVLGLQTGIVVHIVAAICGLSAVIAASDVLFDAIRYGGALYLVWLGIASIRARHQPIEETVESRSGGLRRTYLQAIVVDVLNPKVGLFFLAFLPQFVDPARGDAWRQILALGVVFMLVGLVSDMMYALTSGSIGNWLARNASIARLRGIAAGLVYIGLGAFAAFSGSGSSRK